MQKIVHVQTLPNLHHIYVLDSIVKFCATGISAYIRPTAYVYTKQSNSTDWNLISCNMTALPPVLSNSKLLPPPLSHCTFIPPQKNLVHVYKMLLLHYFLKYFLDAIKKLWKATISFVTSVHPSSWNNLDPTGQIVMKFYIWVFFQNFVTNIQVSVKAHKNNRYFIHEDQYTFLIIITQFILRMRNVSDKSCRENQNTYYVQ
jgi:hypothetical protein